MSITRFKFAPAIVAAVLLMVAFVAESTKPSFAQYSHRYGPPSPFRRRESIRLPEVPPAAKRLEASVRRPEDLDGATERLGINSQLLNFHLATPVDLSYMGLGKAIHIPAQISDRKGGRKSIFFIQPGEEVLAGIFVIEDGVALRYVKRRNGWGTPATAGDTYEIRVTTIQGETIYQEQSRLEVVDLRRGTGQLVPMRGRGQGNSQAATSVLMLWSSLYLQRPGGYY